MNGFSLEAPKSPEIEKKPLRIIYIEDQEEFRNLVKEELKKFPADVELVASFSSTEEARKYLMGLNKGLPDAIVSDFSFGDKKATGIQFAKDLKKLEFKIPVILLTSNASDFKDVSEEQLKAMGLTGVVGKMIEMRDFVEFLKQVKPR